MTGFAVLLLGASLAYGLARWRRLPAVPFLLVAGVLLNLAGLTPERALLEETLQLGLAFLVFAAGIELNPKRVGAQRNVAMKVGVAQFLVLGAIGFLVVAALGATVQESFYLALALAASSTLLVVRLLQQRKQMFEPFGRLVLGVLLLQDLFVILMLPIVSGISAGLPAAARGMAASMVLVGAAFAFIRWVAPRLILDLDLDEEGILLVTLGILFAFIGAAIWLDLPMIAGAFLAGVALSGFPVSGIVRGQLGSLSDFFLAVFLTGLGGIIGMPDARDLAMVVTLVAVVLIVTPPLVTVIAESAGLSARASIEGGLLLAQTSEFSLVIALQGLAMGHLDDDMMTVVALVTIITMFLTPFVATNKMTWRMMALHPLRRGPHVPSESVEDHVLLLGCGDNGMPLLETLMAAGQPVMVVDDDPAVIEALREGDIPCIRGDGSDFEVLRRAGAQRASVIISTMRRPRDSLHMLGQVKGIPVLVRVFDDGDAESIRRGGGIPISYAEAASEDFLMWLEQATAFGLQRERRTRPRPV